MGVHSRNGENAKLVRPQRWYPAAHLHLVPHCLRVTLSKVYRTRRRLLGLTAPIHTRTPKIKRRSARREEMNFEFAPRLSQIVKDMLHSDHGENAQSFRCDDLFHIKFTIVTIKINSGSSM